MGDRWMLGLRKNVLFPLLEGEVENTRERERERIFLISLA